MLNFKSSLALRVFNFAIKVEKLSKDSSKAKDIEQLKALAKLQGLIELHVNEMFRHTKEAEMLIKKIGKEDI